MAKPMSLPLALSFFFTFQFSAFSPLTSQANEKPLTAPLQLSPDDVAQLILKQSLQAKEISLQTEQNRLTLATARSAFDFTFQADYGEQVNRFESSSLPAFLEDRSTLANLSLEKPFSTGTTLGIEFSKTISRPVYSSAATSPAVDSATSVFGFTLEQDLLRNVFGKADRALIRSAEATVQAGEISKLSQLQDLVLEGMQLYWAAVVAQETFQNAVSSRDRYAKLVGTVKRKTGYGYTGPGELSQAQAELESREQKVKAESATYLATLERLLTLLRLPAPGEVQFSIPKEIPPPPPMGTVPLENLRPLRASRLNLQAATESLVAGESEALPDVSLVGKYFTQGLDENPREADTEMTSGSKPRYYVGVQVEYNFGSDYQAESVLNRRLNRDLANTRLQRQTRELADKGQDLQRRIQSTYAIAQSAKTQRDLREKAAQELSRSYNQGRTDIAILIEALNKFYDSEVQLVKTFGDYQMSLNQWAAFKDELIPSRN